MGLNIDLDLGRILLSNLASPVLFFFAGWMFGSWVRELRRGS